MTMLIGLENHLRPTNPLKQSHQAIVVSNVDPMNRARIKVKIQGLLEAEDLAALPWVYPEKAAGGNVDNSSHAVPDVFSLVTVSFPTADIYYPTYTTSMAAPQAQAGAFIENPVPDGLENAPNPQQSQSHNLEGYSWSNTNSRKVNWLRIDKNQGKVELFLGESGAFVAIDRGGNAIWKLPGDLVEVIGGNRLTKIVGKQVTQIGGDQITQVTGQQHTRVTGALTLNTDADLALKAGGSSAIVAAGDHETKAGGGLGNTAGGTLKNQAAKITNQMGALGKADGIANKEAPSLDELTNRAASLEETATKLVQQAAALQQAANEIRGQLAAKAKTLVGETIK